LSGQLDQCARLSFPCSLYWIQSSQLIFLSAKLNTCVCVCLVAMNSIILLWVISVYLKSCGINYFRCLTRTCRLFADEHSLSFFWREKNVKCRCIDRKKIEVFLWEERKKNLSVRRKIFKVWRKGEKKNISVKFRVFGKKRIERKVPERKKIKVFFGSGFVS